MPDETKKTRAPQTGMALEIDVIKKIGHQLERGLTPEAMHRVMQFVVNAVQEKRTLAIKSMGRNGQLQVPGTEDNQEQKRLGDSSPFDL